MTVETKKQVRRKALDDAANAVPTSWLDPLLTGPDAVLPKDFAITPRHIEALLRGVQDRIRALKNDLAAASSDRPTDAL